MFKIAKESTIENDLFNAPEKYKIVTINCIGAMGRGIALACKQRYPDIFKDYRAKAKAGEIYPGKVYVYEDEEVILFPTKREWFKPSQLSDIIDTIGDLTRTDDKLKFGSVALPPLGMVNGWLKPRDKLIVLDALNRCCHPKETLFKLYLPDDLYLLARQYFGRS